jgi:hypothetical protein
VQALQREAQATRGFIARSPRRLNRKGQELKSNVTESNVTDPDSGKMATGKGVIQGYSEKAAVDDECQIIAARLRYIEHALMCHTARVRAGKP